jgi:pyruvate dehydrogenase E2 component (dihydrolipoamide acetyltransferase)
MSAIKPFDIRQKIIAASTSTGWEAPHVSFVCRLPVEALVGYLHELNDDQHAGSQGDSSQGGAQDDNERRTAPRIAFNTLVVYLLVQALRENPLLNTRIHYHRLLASGHLEPQEHIDVNMPVLLASGEMMTVCLEACERQSLTDLQAMVNSLSERVANTDMAVPLMQTGLDDTYQMLRKGSMIKPLGRFVGLKIGKSHMPGIARKRKRAYRSMEPGGRIEAHELRRGTVTISNLGAAIKGIDGYPAIIDLVSPQVLAIGIGALHEGTLPLCLVFDHRALDFPAVAPFVKRIAELFAKPRAELEKTRDLTR